MQRLHEERANVLLERHVANNFDELIEIEVAMSVAKMMLARGVGIAITTITTTTIIVMVQDGTSNTPKLDEFGYDVNLQNCQESKRQAHAHECWLKK
jgi:hypothetical protein